MEIMKLKKNALFNPAGDTATRLRRLIGGNTTNLNDFNNVRYKWVSDGRNKSHPGCEGLYASGQQGTHGIRQDT